MRFQIWDPTLNTKSICIPYMPYTGRMKVILIFETYCCFVSIRWDFSLSVMLVLKQFQTYKKREIFRF